MFVKSQRFKVFCQAFCKKLAAEGFRPPLQITPRGRADTFGMQNLKFLN